MNHSLASCPFPESEIRRAGTLGFWEASCAQPLLSFSRGVLVWLSTGIGLLHIIGVLRGQATVNVNQPTIVRQQLQRLETVNYTADKIISGGHASAYLPNFLAGDRLLLVVPGKSLQGSISRIYSRGMSKYRARKCRFTFRQRKS